MVLTDRVDFEEMIHHLAVLGVAAFLLWGAAGVMSWAAGLATIAREPAIRFMAAIMVLVVPEVDRSVSAEGRLGVATEG
jgi:hypothetical protein